MRDDMSPDSLPPSEPNDQTPDAAANGGADGAQLPIPYVPPANPRALSERRRLRHRRKRFALYVVRNQRRRLSAKARTRQRLLLFSVGALLAIIFGTIGSVAEAAYSYYQSELPVLEALQNSVTNSDSVQIYDRYGTLIYQANYNGIKHSIPFNQVPQVAINATVAIEDKDFWTNNGVDFNRIVSAAYQDYIQHNPNAALQGASTITQQLIKNTVLDSAQTFDRKIREAILSYGITVGHLFDSNPLKNKQTIITLYFDTIPYGPDVYGIDSAAFEYFGYKDDPRTGVAAASHLDLAQASFLAGIPQNPNVYDPLNKYGLSRALIRQSAEVLPAMVKQGYITQAQANAAIKEAHAPGFIKPPPPEDTQNLAPDFVQFVINQLNSMIISGQVNTGAAPGELKAARSGLKVYTTLDLPLQWEVQQIMADHLFCNDIDDYGTILFNDHTSEAAAVLAEQATGDLRVLLGSWDYYANEAPHTGVTPARCSFHKPTYKNGKYTPAQYVDNPYGQAVNNKFDVATEGYRQPGSTFKLFDYSTAFEQGWFPAMTIDDVPTIFPDPGGPTGNYKPLDAEREFYYGEMTIRRALQYSMDIPAIKTLSFDGIPNVLRMMSRLGITSYQNTPGLAMAIGSLGVHPIDMVQSYATVANYGNRIPFNGIDYILDGQGNEIYRYSPPRGTQELSPQVSYLMTNVLSDNPMRINTRPGQGFGFGGCSPLFLYYNNSCNPNTGTATYYFPAAAKTGTTDNLDDDWTMGYTMDYVGGVWVGNNNEADSMYHIDGITGAAPIWNRMMLTAELEKSTIGVGIDHTPRQFPVPQGVVRATFSSNNTTTTDWFLANNVPTEEGFGNGGPTKVCFNINNTDNTWQYCSGGSGGSGGNPPHKPHP
jgi:membrane peptidoglycan carboxypeptidase